MNQKNSLGLNKCFLELDDPFKLFEKWFAEAKKKEINDPNALALGTASKTGVPSVRMVLLKGFDENGFVFYTNLNSQKSSEIKSNPNASMCFHWKSLLRQVRITGGYQTFAATLTTKKINDSFLGEFSQFKHLFHGHTYTGNPTAAALSLKNLELYKKYHLIEKIQKNGI